MDDRFVRIVIENGCLKIVFKEISCSSGSGDNEELMNDLEDCEFLVPAHRMSMNPSHSLITS